MSSTSASTTKWKTDPKDIERWLTLRAKDVMRTDVITISYAAPLSHVEETFSHNQVSGAPVTDEAGHIIGVVSMKDLVGRYVEDPDSRPHHRAFYHVDTEEMFEENLDVRYVPEEAEETAESIMTPEVIGVPIDATLEQVAAAMGSNRVHRVLVQENGKCMGLISTQDVLRALAG